jgi:hypothetical protein
LLRNTLTFFKHSLLWLIKYLCDQREMDFFFIS